MPPRTRNTIHLHPGLSAASFAVSAAGERAWVQAMEMYDGYFKRAFHARLPVVRGAVHCDLERDVLKVAIVDRHHATETVGIVRAMREVGLKSPSGRAPRLHDLRHRFAVRTLVNWYRAGLDVEANLPLLSTYMGHACPENTFWYLSAVPELLFLAAERLERREEARS